MPNADAGDTRPLSTEGKSPTARPLFLLIYSAGLIASLIVYGLLQERIMTGSYDGDSFIFPTFLIFWNRIFALAFGLVMMLCAKESFALQAPLWKYFIISMTNVFASVCQYESLKYISFVVMMLGKSFKMMPVMFWCMTMAGKRYGIRDWLIAAAVTGGVCMFLMSDKFEDSSGTRNSFRGLLLVVLYLLLDGLTSTMQQQVLTEHNCSKYHLVMYVNLVSVGVSSITLGYEDSFGQAMSFCWGHDTVWTHVVVLSLSMMVGQFFIYSLIEEFGALVFAATMNVRQLCSIIVSYIGYSHPLAPTMFVGIIIVFGALAYKSYIGLTEAQGESQPLLSKTETTNDAYKNSESMKNHSV